MMSEVFEFEYNALQEMLIVNYQENFSYNMCNEDDVYSVAVKLNELQSTILRLEEENEQLRKQVAEYDMILRQHEFAEKEGFK